LIDTIGCGLKGLRFLDCRHLLDPVVEDTIDTNSESSPHTTSDPAEPASLILRFRN
jgi:hypothetical protein